MSQKNTKSMLMLISSMVIFGTVGIFRRFIPLPSGVIAMLRGIFGALFLVAVMLIGRIKPDRDAIRQNLLLLCISGATMGVNWILLFEAYNCTTVVTATLCYYMAPVFVILASPVVHEKLTARKLICVLLALIGMVFVSGAAQSGMPERGELRGVLFSLSAAMMYASIVLMNKCMKPIPAYDRTVIQLMTAGLVMLIYTGVSGQLRGLTMPPLVLVMLAVVCIVHTGLAYALYFGSTEKLPAHILAIFSYIDPVVALILSALVLHEPLTASTALGAVLILGGALMCDLKK